MDLKKLIVDNNSDFLILSGLTLRESAMYVNSVAKQKELQFVVSAKTRLKRYIDSIEVHYFDQDNVFLGADICECFDLSIASNLERTVSVDLNEPENYSSAILKIRSTSWIRKVDLSSIIIFSILGFMLLRILRN